MLNYNKFPVGVTSFSEIVQKKLILIDKTMMIKDVMEDGCKAMLITRPRRFGKTLNMNMLGEFFSLKGKDVFGGLNIAKDSEFCAQHQNQYPVISITFKECKGAAFKNVLEQIKHVFKMCYGDHEYLLQSSSLSQEKKESFKDILDGKVDDSEKLVNAILNLTAYLHAHTGKQVVLLIDEYDSPIHSAYSNGFYDEIIDFMRKMLGGALKDNPHLEKAVMTGIARVAKESMFSGLNHLMCYTLMDPEYAQYFGFTQSEVESLISPSLSSRGQSPKDPPLGTDESQPAHDTCERQILCSAQDGKRADGKGRDALIEEIKRWYNGYKIGNYQIYNPWSIMHCLKKNMEMGPYWLNTSDNALVYELIGNSDMEFKTKVENLIKGIPQEQVIEDNLTFREMEGNDTAIWTLLFHAGYLNIVSRTLNEYGRKTTTIEIPNMEILSLYMNIVERWFALDNKDHYYLDFIKSLESDNPDKFLKLVEAYISSSLSYFDLNKKTPEYVFHIFMMGLLVGFRGRYEVNSNGEAGDGRYDVIMIPKNSKDKAILMEFKVANTEEVLQETAQIALKQISDKRYTDAFTGKVLCIGMAFCGKKMTGQSSLIGNFT